ncbi:MAG: FKBP-type peptidyl-prolyl cis-trans isomerase N-terminal domain-containing protein, partial [Bacteroidota bacterium]
MKFRFYFSAFPFLSTILLLAACNQTASVVEAPQSYTDSLSYVLGANFAKYYIDLNAEVDEAQLVQGFKDAMRGDELAVSEQSSEQLMQQFSLKLQASDHTADFTL